MVSETPTSETATGDGRRTIRVVLGEDDLIAREGITRLLEDLDGVELVAACADLPSLEDAVERLRPDAVLTDIRMPPTATDEGIRLARRLRSTHPGIGVVVLSQHVEPLYALALLENGSGGRAYLLKERISDKDELGRALREVTAGGAVVDALVVDEVLTQRRQQANSPLSRLTTREHETLALLAQGRSNSAIAEALGVTRRGVERHINAIFAKLGLTDPQRVDRRVAATLMYLAEDRE
ncbi:MAG TPA: response regulator transcription factor [Gaiellaceae bacterium]|nr:response regulator transcription factor [Gaiellaceae bacterium]